MIISTIFFKKLWLYIKKYWQLGLIAVASVAGYLLLRKEREGFSEQLKKLQEAHDDEIKAVLVAHEEERRQHEENLKKLKETMEHVQRQYDDAKKVLDEKKKKKIVQLVQQYGDDPNELAKQLSSVTGFNVVLPQDKGET